MTFVVVFILILYNKRTSGLYFLIYIFASYCDMYYLDISIQRGLNNPPTPHRGIKMTYNCTQMTQPPIQSFKVKYKRLEISFYIEYHCECMNYYYLIIALLFKYHD